MYLDTNQNGEWDWPAEETGVGVATAVADLLTGNLLTGKAQG